MATLYEQIVEPRLEDIAKWAKDGSTEKEIAKALGISYSSFRGYKKKHPELEGVLLSNKFVPDMKALGSFFKRVEGYEYKEVTKERQGGKLIVTKEVTKQVPPDVEAGKFWLKNRRPDEFSDTHKFDHEGTIRSEKLEDIISQLGGEGLDE